MAYESNNDGNARHSTLYVWKSAAVNKAGTAAGDDLTAITGFTDLLTQFTSAGRKPRYIKILSSGALYVKINGGDKITIGATTPFEADYLEVNSITVSSGGAEVTVTVQMQ